ncbi:sigma-70 family RNA polymerase sigma factor [bacterium]|nr:sigma-70 family RNA polymerase sigma factor [bacterium]MDB4391885.1 sigma-70 family RNA polymerase sigma factor [bacterium]
MYFMDHSEILKILMPERTKQIALAWSILRQSHMSEDAYQDMLAKVLANRGIFEGPQHLRDWSWKVLRNRCYELIRQRKYQMTLLDESILNLVDAELESRDTSDVALRADALHDCLEGLSERARETIRMRYFEGLRGKQVAEKLGRKPEAVYKALQRTYTTLADCIQRKLTALETGVPSS